MIYWILLQTKKVFHLEELYTDVFITYRQDNDVYIFALNFQVPCSSWFDDMDDRELLDLIPLLEKLSKVDSVYSVLKNKEQLQQHLQQVTGNNQSSLKRSQNSGASSAASGTAAVT